MHDVGVAYSATAATLWESMATPRPEMARPRKPARPPGLRIVICQCAGEGRGPEATGGGRESKEGRGGGLKVGDWGGARHSLTAHRQGLARMPTGDLLCDRSITQRCEAVRAFSPATEASGAGPGAEPGPGSRLPCCRNSP